MGNRTGGISRGDRAYLYRYQDHRGIVASGMFTSGVAARLHWDGSGRTARYADLEWDILLDYDDRLPLEVLNHRSPADALGPPSRLGHRGQARRRPALHALWQRHTGGILFRSPDEPRSHDDLIFPEGAISRVEINRYERDPRARRACLRYWGYQPRHRGHRPPPRLDWRLRAVSRRGGDGGTDVPKGLTVDGGDTDPGWLAHTQTTSHPLRGY